MCLVAVGNWARLADWLGSSDSKVGASVITLATCIGRPMKRK